MKELILLKVITAKNVWFVTIDFCNYGFKFQDYVCNGCHDLNMLCLNISDSAIIAVKGVDCCYDTPDITISEPIRLLENSVLDD